MKNGKTQKRLRTFFTWLGWVLLFQFILINITAANYAKKLTTVYPPPDGEIHASRDVFSKTWRLFTGIRYYRSPLVNRPEHPFSTVRLRTASGRDIEGWYIPTDSASAGTVILFHSLFGNKGQLLKPAEDFRKLGYSVLLIDVRAHGNSEGSVTTIGFREAEEVKLANDYILQRGEKNIFFWGFSMGAVELMKAVADYGLKPSGIIIEMPFLSLKTHLEGRARTLGFPEEPFALLTSFWIGVERGFNGWKFKTDKYAAKINCPVLMQYGKDDKLVLSYETEKIFESLASTDKKLVAYEGIGHSLIALLDPANWEREVREFVKKNGKAGM
jgi:alpha-beta hydrolase superfamily lysophospholipase